MEMKGTVVVPAGTVLAGLRRQSSCLAAPLFELTDTRTTTRPTRYRYTFDERTFLVPVHVAYTRTGSSSSCTCILKNTNQSIPGQHRTLQPLDRRRQSQNHH